MKKCILLLLVIMGWMSSAQALDVEVRAAYFSPQDSRMRKIYGSGFAEWELEAALPLGCYWDCACGFDGFVNVAYYQKSGTSTCRLVKDSTTVKNWAFNFGVLREFDTCTCFRPYLGLGFGGVHVDFHDRSDYVKKHNDQWGVATLVKTGVKVDVMCNVFVDVFVDYTYHWFKFDKKHCRENRNVNTGGVLVGAGIGYRF